MSLSEKLKFFENAMEDSQKPTPKSGKFNFTGRRNFSNKLKYILMLFFLRREKVQFLESRRSCSHERSRRTKNCVTL